MYTTWNEMGGRGGHIISIPPYPTRSMDRLVRRHTAPPSPRESFLSPNQTPDTKVGFVVRDTWILLHVISQYSYNLLLPHSTEYIPSPPPTNPSVCVEVPRKAVLHNTFCVSARGLQGVNPRAELGRKYLVCFTNNIFNDVIPRVNNDLYADLIQHKLK